MPGLANEIGEDAEKPTAIHVDNQAWVAITKNSVSSQKMKHFAITLVFIQEKQIVTLRCWVCPTTGMIAALLRKLLAEVKVESSKKTLRGM